MALESKGVMASGGWYGDYWEYLLELSAASQRLQGWSAHRRIFHLRQNNSQTGYTPHIHWLRLSALGEQFYRENWQRYRELYPEVGASVPDD
jgi:hypothetical protein